MSLGRRCSPCCAMCSRSASAARPASSQCLTPPRDGVSWRPGTAPCAACLRGSDVFAQRVRGTARVIPVPGAAARAGQLAPNVAPSVACLRGSSLHACARRLQLRLCCGGPCGACAKKNRNHYKSQVQPCISQLCLFRAMLPQQSRSHEPPPGARRYIPSPLLWPASAAHSWQAMHEVDTTRYRLAASADSIR